MICEVCSVCSGYLNYKWVKWGRNVENVELSAGGGSRLRVRWPQCMGSFSQMYLGTHGITPHAAPQGHDIGYRCPITA